MARNRWLCWRRIHGAVFPSKTASTFLFRCSAKVGCIVNLTPHFPFGNLLVRLQQQAICSGGMKAHRTFTATVLGAALAFVPVSGWSQQSTPSQDSGVKHDVKRAGQTK